jgi:hypothetical protein
MNGLERETEVYHASTTTVATTVEFSYRFPLRHAQRALLPGNAPQSTDSDPMGGFESVQLRPARVRLQGTILPY